MAHYDTHLLKFFHHVRSRTLTIVVSTGISHPFRRALRTFVVSAMRREKQSGRMEEKVNRGTGQVRSKFTTPPYMETNELVRDVDRRRTRGK